MLPLISEARSTNDLDMFLTTDVIVNLPKAKAVLQAVQGLGFTVVEKREIFNFTIEDNPVPVVLTGLRTTGEAFGGQVYLAPAYSYLMMKLFAFRDWEKVNKSRAAPSNTRWMCIVSLPC